MKTIINIAIALLITGLHLCTAQTMPEPPQPPQPPSTTLSSISGNYKVSINSSDSSTGENISFSVTNRDDRYSLKANFPKKVSPELLAYLMEVMGSRNIVQKGGKTQWIANTDGEEVYEISLSKDRLQMYIDKEIASDELIEKFGEIGRKTKAIITGKDAETEEVERLERQAHRLRRDANRMHIEAMRLERQAQRDAQRLEIEQQRLNRDKERANVAANRVLRDAQRAREDAQRIEREARKIALEAEKAGLRSAAKGGMDDAVREVLQSPATFYDTTKAQNRNGWKWPAFQQALLMALEEDALISQDNELIFVRDNTGMYVNGQQLDRQTEGAYLNIFATHGYDRSDYFTFYKLYDHILVINANARILEFFEAMKAAGNMSDLKKEYKLEINGDTMRINGEALAPAVVKNYNTLLHKHNIIPAPGKVIALLKGGDYKLGYSLGNRTHIGTWGIND
ncbi:MAG: hypothetical protein ABNH00_09435 [Dokdonia sp.]|jgi:hypothetical protein